MGRFWTNVEIDGAPFGQNGSYTYLHAEVVPGRHSVTSRGENTDTLEFDAEAGAIYFIAQEKKFGWFAPRTKLHLVPEAEGRKGVQGTRLVDATHRTEDQNGAKLASASWFIVIPVAIAAAIVSPGVGAAAILAGAH
jgi:hypothetical protein